MHALLASLISLFLLAPFFDGWLGVWLSEQDEPIIAEVVPDSPAFHAGIKVGDLMLAVGDKVTATREEFIAAIQAGKVGDRVSIRLRRDGKEQTLVVKLGERPSQVERAAPAEPKTQKPKGQEPKTQEPKAQEKAKGQKPSQPAGESAPKAKPLTPVKPKARPYLGLALRESNDGVVIERVLPDGPGKAAGIEAGDIVTSLGDRSVKELGDLDRFLETAKAGDKVAFGLRNKDGARSITIVLGERPSKHSDEKPEATAEAVPPAASKPKAAPSEPAPAPAAKPRPRAESKPAVDLEAELAALRAELAKLRQELEELRKQKGRQ
ncbi:MAG TPA: PDZ domain-containing protein [Planctomycetota bacterium]